ncbi:CopZ family metallochaperone [Thiolapillus brandeum]|uniref:Heavy metal transport/detoxification protein n=1 Tax=Thiolapillus brandeum TaxID=1076588 RepID=A0A7U6GIY3_9GAMM|nr:cation transporter [Thiolapillus brandeum]BAO44471.1 heavy metal transport/detoxification protein [Thiolapillus brandeum]
MTTETRLKITGMTCGHCMAHTKKALEAVPGVVEAGVSLEPGGAVVQGEANVEDLIAAVKEAGYEAEVAH